MKNILIEIHTKTRNLIKMAKDYDFCKDAMLRSERCNRQWYQKYLCNVLDKAKENRARDIDTSIALAHDLVQVHYF